MAQSEQLSPYGLELRNAPQSGLMGYYFPWSSHLKGFDTSSYNPLLSDNTISKYDVDMMMNEVNSIPGINPNYCDSYLWWSCLSIPIMGAGIYLGILNLIRSPPNITLYIIFLMGGIILGFFYFFYIVIQAGKKANKRRYEVKQKISLVLNKHQNMNFTSKNSVVRVSENAAYIAIEFKFRLPGFQNIPNNGYGYNQPFLTPQSPPAFPASTNPFATGNNDQYRRAPGY